MQQCQLLRSGANEFGVLAVFCLRFFGWNDDLAQQRRRKSTIISGELPSTHKSANSSGIKGKRSGEVSKASHKSCCCFSVIECSLKHLLSSIEGFASDESSFLQRRNLTK